MMPFQVVSEIVLILQKQKNCVGKDSTGVTDSKRDFVI